MQGVGWEGAIKQGEGVGPDVEKGLNLANDTNEYIELNLFMEIGANNSKIN